MSWTYSGNPASSERDAVRFYLQDVDAGDRFMTDEELDFLVEKWGETYGSMIMVAAIAAEVLSNRFARELDVSGDGVSISAGQLQERFNALALNLRDQYKAEVGTQAFVEDFSGVLAQGYDSTLAPLWAGMGQHDNPEAGHQMDGRPQRRYDELEQNYP